MTQEQEKHLQYIKDTFCTSVDTKYRAGQEEHGGDLWAKRNVIDFAIEEALDLVTYLVTVKKQIEESGVQLGTLEDKA